MMAFTKNDWGQRDIINRIKALKKGIPQPQYLNMQFFGLSK